MTMTSICLRFVSIPSCVAEEATSAVHSFKKKKKTEHI